MESIEVVQPQSRNISHTSHTTRQQCSWKQSASCMWARYDGELGHIQYDCIAWCVKGSAVCMQRLWQRAPGYNYKIKYRYKVCVMTRHICNLHTCWQNMQRLIHIFESLYNLFWILLCKLHVVDAYTVRNLAKVGPYSLQLRYADQLISGLFICMQCLWIAKWMEFQFALCWAPSVFLLLMAWHCVVPVALYTLMQLTFHGVSHNYHTMKLRFNKYCKYLIQSTRMNCVRTSRYAATCSCAVCVHSINTVQVAKYHSNVM